MDTSLAAPRATSCLVPYGSVSLLPTAHVTVTLSPVLLSKLAIDFSSGSRIGVGASKVISVCARAPKELPRKTATTTTDESKYFTASSF